MHSPPEPTWFRREPSAHRPCLRSLPASLVVMQGPDGAGVHHLGVLWVPVGDQLLALPMSAPLQVLAEGPVLLVVDSAGRSLRAEAGSVELWTSDRRRDGVDRRCERVGALWPTAPTEGARSSPRSSPFARGRGHLWIDAGWLYRAHEGGPVEVLGPAGAGALLHPGPHGAALLGDRERWTHGALPRGPLVPLDPPLLVDGSARFTPDGTGLVGRWRAADFVRLDLSTGQVLGHTDGGIPLAEGGLEPGDGSPPGEALLAQDPATDGRWLAGPQGCLWDLAAPGLTRGPSLPGLGPTAATPHGWATWDEGRILWFDPATGRVTQRVRGPRQEPSAAWGDATGAAFLLPDGSVHVARAQPGDGVVGTPQRPPPPEPAPAAAQALGFAYALRREHDAVWWSDDGLLAIAPGPGVTPR